MFVYFNLLNSNESLFYTVIKFTIHYLIKMMQRKIIIIIIKFWHRSCIFWTSIMLDGDKKKYSWQLH